VPPAHDMHAFIYIHYMHVRPHAQLWSTHVRRTCGEHLQHGSSHGRSLRIVPAGTLFNAHKPHKSPLDHPEIGSQMPYNASSFDARRGAAQTSRLSIPQRFGSWPRNDFPRPMGPFLKNARTCASSPQNFGDSPGGTCACMLVLAALGWPAPVGTIWSTGVYVTENRESEGRDCEHYVQQLKVGPLSRSSVDSGFEGASHAGEGDQGE